MDLTKEKEYVEKLKGITHKQWKEVKWVIDCYFEHKQREYEKTLTLSDYELIYKFIQ